MATTAIDGDEKLRNVDPHQRKVPLLLKVPEVSASCSVPLVGLEY